MKKIIALVLLLSMISFNFAYAVEEISNSEKHEEEARDGQVNDEEGAKENDDSTIVSNEEESEEEATEEEATEEEATEEEATEDDDVKVIFDDEVDYEKQAGITPDSPFYSISRLIEKIRLALTFDEEKKAEFLFEIMKTRLAEAKVMTDRENLELAQKAIAEYIAILEQLQEKVSEIILDMDKDEELKEKLEQKLEDGLNVNEEVEENLEDEIKEELAEKIDQAYLVANVVRGLDQEKVIALRQQGLGYGQIAQVFMLAEASGKSVEEVGALFENKGFGSVAKELGLHPSQIKSKKAPKAIRNSVEVKEENEGTVEKDEDDSESYKSEAKEENKEIKNTKAAKESAKKKAELVREADKKQAEIARETAKKQAEIAREAAKKESENAKGKANNPGNKGKRPGSQANRNGIRVYNN